MAIRNEFYYTLSVNSFGEFNQTTRCIKQVLEAMDAGIIEPFYAHKIIRTMYYEEIESMCRARDAEPPERDDD